MTQATIPIGIVSVDPIILAMFWYRSNFVAQLELLSAELRRQNAVIFVFIAWSILDRSDAEINELVDAVNSYTRRNPRHIFIISANDDQERERLHMFGLPSYTLNHNAFYVNINSFNIKPTEKKYRAIYNAQIQPYKRHQLMKKIDNACIIYSSCDAKYLESLPKSFFDYYFPNGRPFRDNWISLDSTQVAANCNLSQVGLCLSKIEGAMLAAVEYALCGLPIVSTRSIGGRSYLFDAEYTRVVDDDPEIIQNAVTELIALKIDPYDIRRSVLRKIFNQRLVAAEIAFDALQSVGTSVLESDLVARFVTLPRFPWKRYSYEDLDRQLLM